MARRPPDSEWINPALLDNKTRNELWTGLKSLDPSLAKLLKTDPNLSQLKQAFGATVCFTRAKAKAYVIEGRKLLEEKRNAIDNTRS